jgi:hypothetical protein
MTGSKLWGKLGKFITQPTLDKCRTFYWNCGQDDLHDTEIKP